MPITNYRNSESNCIGRMLYKSVDYYSTLFNIGVSWIKVVFYIQSAHPDNLNVNRELVDIPKGRQHHIPYSCAAIKAGEASPAAVERLTHGGDVIARKVQEDLYGKMKTVIDGEKMKGVVKCLYYYLILLLTMNIDWNNVYITVLYSWYARTEQ